MHSDCGGLPLIPTEEPWYCPDHVEVRAGLQDQGAGRKAGEKASGTGGQCVGRIGAWRYAVGPPVVEGLAPMMLPTVRRW